MESSSSMMALDTSRAVVGAGLWFAVSALMTGGANLMGSATSGALMGVAVFANGALHSAIDMPPTTLTSAAATGAAFAALEAVVRGDRNYVINAAAGAAVDVGTETAGAALGYTA